MRTSTKKVKTNSIQMIHNRQGNPSLSCIMTYYHGQFPYFHRRREEKAKLSPPWDPTNFEPKLLAKSTHSFLPGNLSGVTSSSKTLNQDFSHLDRASASGAAKLRFSRERTRFCSLGPELHQLPSIHHHRTPLSMLTSQETGRPNRR